LTISKHPLRIPCASARGVVNDGFSVYAHHGELIQKN
jgi:hypothetical protein